MKPTPNEIETVSNAMITLIDLEYTPEQLTYISTFLKGYAQDLNDLKMSKVFSNQLQAIDAIRALHDYAFQFQGEEDLYAEFQTEIDEVAISIHYHGDRGKIMV